MSEQRSSENIQQELDTMGIITYWKQGSWKTTISLELAFENWEKRIYSNFSIFKNWKQINRVVSWIWDILKIRFSYTPWVIIIDEAGINANSKDWRSETNRILIETLFLARKFNCSFIWISQRFESIDVNARVLSDLILQMHKLRRGGLHPLFRITRQVQRWNKLEMYNIHTIDTIKLMEYDKLTYNTLETSKFETWTEIKTRRKNWKKEGEEWAIVKVDINTPDK